MQVLGTEVGVTENENPDAMEPERRRFQEVYGHPAEADARAIAQWVEDLYHEQDSAMYSRFHQWSYNIQFASGRQWLATTDGRSWFEPPPPSGSIRVTNNLVWRASEYRISKLTESRQIGKIIPHSNEVKDADRAEAGQHTINHLDRELDMGLVYDEALWYDTLCGSAFIFVGWESGTGEFIAAKKSRVVGADEMGEPIVQEYFCDAEGNEVDFSRSHLYQTGEVDACTIPPWAIRVSDPQETNPRKQRRWMWGAIEEVSEIKRTFGALADHVTGGDEYNQFVYHEDLISGWANDGFRKKPNDRQFVARALVIRFFERPSGEFRMGRYIVVCEGKLIYYDALPFGDDEIGYDIPIIQLKTVHKPKDFYGFCTIEPWIPIQKRINQLESHAIEYIRLFAKGGITTELGTLIEESYNDSYGKILYFQGERPQALAWPAMPSDVMGALNRAYENFDRISGWADVARGEVPGQVKAARAILELKRSNDTPIGKALQRFDRVVEQVSKKMLERARWGYSEPHWVQLIGADAPHLVRAVASDDLPVKFSVRIETDSMLRLSYPAKLELLFEMADRQWVDKDAAMRLLNFADWEHTASQWNRDYGRARGKIEKLVMGQPVTVEWWEDDAVYMLALAERLKDPRFEQLPIPVQANLTQLWIAHYQQWMMKQQGMLPPQLQSGPTGAPPEMALKGAQQDKMGPSQQQPQKPAGQPTRFGEAPEANNQDRDPARYDA